MGPQNPEIASMDGALQEAPAALPAAPAAALSAENVRVIVQEGLQPVIGLLHSHNDAAVGTATARHAEAMSKLEELHTCMKMIQTDEQKRAWFGKLIEKNAWYNSEIGLPRRPKGLENAWLWQQVLGIPGDIRPRKFPANSAAMVQMLTLQKGLLWEAQACGRGFGSTTFYWSLQATSVPENVRGHPKYKAPAGSESEAEVAVEEDGDDQSEKSSSEGSDNTASGSGDDGDDENGTATAGSAEMRLNRLKAKLRDKKVVAHFLHSTVCLANGQVNYQRETPAVSGHWQEFLLSVSGMKAAEAQEKANDELHDVWLEYELKIKDEESGNSSDGEAQEGDEQEGEQENKPEQEGGEQEGDGDGEENKGEENSAQGSESGDPGGYYSESDDAYGPAEEGRAPPGHLAESSPEPASVGVGVGSTRTRSAVGKFGSTPVGGGKKPRGDAPHEEASAAPQQLIGRFDDNSSDDGDDPYGGVPPGQPGYTKGYEGE